MEKIELYRKLVEDPEYAQVASRLDGYNIRTFVRGDRVIAFYYGGILNKNTKVKLSVKGIVLTEDFNKIVEIVNES